MQTVLITGANRGIGLEYANQYAADGWHVLATAREPKKATDLHIAGSKIEVLPLDVTDGDSIAALAKTLTGKPIDVVINNAGIMGPRPDDRFGKQDLSDQDYQEWLTLMATNTIAPFRISSALLPNLKAAAKANGIAKLCFTSSSLGSIANAKTGDTYYPYRSSKAALNMLGHTIAGDLKDENIMTLLLHPGWVATDMGGHEAPLKPVDSVKGLRRVIAAATMADSGGFKDYQGNTLPW